MTSAPSERPFPRDLLAGDTLLAAHALLGARLVREADAAVLTRREGRIVEVEAYVGLGDRASHARMGLTARNRPMFGPPGFAYVYLVYGMHHCLNVVTEAAGRPAAVLIRAVEPIAGLDAMRAGRGGRTRLADHRLAAGPGNVGAAFGIDRSFSGLDLCDPAARLHLAARPEGEPPPVVVAGPRVGIAYAGEPWASVPWRLAIAGSPALSRRVP
ncbi:MAG TPA: DNA-3-methyladenine glycosylase [Candidatus Limnocylindrales bacterium]